MTDTLTRQHAVIEPRWSTGAMPIDPADYQLDAADFGDVNNGEYPTILGEAMRDRFERFGLVHVVNTGLTDHSDMREIAKLVVDAEMPYRGGANPRRPLEPNVYEIGAPLEAWLHYHHEMAYIGTSTKMIAFLCKRSLPGRGATYVSDNVRATDALLATEFGQKLARLGVCYHRDLTDREAFVGRDPIGVYNHWQLSLGTDDPDEAEQRARERGLQTSWGRDRLLRTRYYVSAFEHFPQLGRNLLFSSVADHSMWFDTWPMVSQLPTDQRPLKMTFGDDSEFTRDELQQFVDVYDQFGTPIDWQVGDVAVICNYRWAHGRPSIVLGADEERELGVLLGESFDRVGDVSEAW